MKLSKEKIIIMCGGRGKRMKDLTLKTPKPLMKIKDKTILEMKIQKYQKEGFNNFIICIGYKGSLIKKLISKGNNPENISFSDAGVDAGILKRIDYAKDLFNETVLLTYGDTYSNINLSELAKAHRENNNEATIAVAPIKSPFGLVEFDNNNKVTHFKEKPTQTYYIGYAAINKKIIDITPNEIIDMPDGKGLVEFYNMLMLDKKLGVYYYDGLQTTFNTKNELEIAKEKIINFYTSRQN
tara:strand:- start:40 stop:759 length:720 start_codon:yes stop_codon:yes gene_type:complete